MFARFVFLLAMCLGLAVAPVRAVGACAEAGGEPSCHRCCAVPEMACCDISSAPVPPNAPAKTAPHSGNAKQLVSPALTLLCLAVTPAVERPAVHRQHAARIPAQPLVFQTCIRLI